MSESESFEGLVAIMDRLRGPDGCPWDREQTWKSLRRFLLEECYEVADALDRADPDELREELGDLLFQIVFLSRLAKEEGQFTADDVVRGIAEKMIRRHPHVFGEDRAETSDEVLRRWEEIKRRERKAGSEGEGEGHRSILDGIPRALPAMMKAGHARRSDLLGIIALLIAKIKYIQSKIYLVWKRLARAKMRVSMSPDCTAVAKSTTVKILKPMSKIATVPAIIGAPPIRLSRTGSSVLLR